LKFPPDDWMQWVTLAIALLALGLNFWDKVWARRPRLKVTFMPQLGTVSSHDPSVEFAASGVSIGLINVGSEPVFPVDLRFLTRRGHVYQLLTGEIYGAIQPKEPKILYLPGPAVARLHMSPEGPIDRVEVSDGAGNVFRSVRFGEDLMVWASMSAREEPGEDGDTPLVRVAEMSQPRRRWLGRG